MGVRTLFRLCQAIVAGGVFLFFITPLKICPRRQHRSYIAVIRHCVSYELRATYCPYYQFRHSVTSPSSIQSEYDDIIEEKCPDLSHELIWTTIISLLLVLFYVFDMAFGRRFMVKYKKWSDDKRRRVYWIVLAITTGCWIVILIAISLALAVTWPEAITSQTYDSDEEKAYLEAKHPPVRWVGTLISAVVMICGKAIEMATLYMFPQVYFEGPKEEPIDDKTFQSLSMMRA